MKTFDLKTTIHFGDDALGRLREIPYRKILIITDPFIANSSMIHLITKPLDMAGKAYEIFSDVVPDAPITKIAVGVEKCMHYKPDCIVAVGGGSAIDSGKAIREFVLKSDYSEKIGLIAIPTTSGTGSEVTAFAVINDTNTREKYPLVSDTITPDEAILDAELVKSVPPSITADTGMDVLTHAIEAFVSSDHNEFSTALAEKAIEICGVFMLKAFLNGNDTRARQKMHAASCLAGIAFNSASLGLNHGMAHQLGAQFHIPHGRANAMLLPSVIECNAELFTRKDYQEDNSNTLKRYAVIAHAIGLSGYDQVMSVRALVNWIQCVLKEMNMPTSISSIGSISKAEYESKIEMMAEAALLDQCTETNPRVVSKAEIIDIYKKLW